jgi:hypothetical protein
VIAEPRERDYSPRWLAEPEKIIIIIIIIIILFKNPSQQMLTAYSPETRKDAASE